jgi:hypothetical protein
MTQGLDRASAQARDEGSLRFESLVIDLAAGFIYRRAIYRPMLGAYGCGGTFFEAADGRTASTGWSRGTTTCRGSMALSLSSAGRMGEATGKRANDWRRHR